MGLPNTRPGCELPRQNRKHIQLDAAAESLLKSAMKEMGLSARAHDKILRVSRTIADLDQSETITSNHLNEAINDRTLDRNYWASLNRRTRGTSSRAAPPSRLGRRGRGATRSCAMRVPKHRHNFTLKALCSTAQQIRH